jgi:glycosyltransferase involved in cell wall biosynthesis
MNILCLTDQFDGSNHSAIEGIFGKYLPEYAPVRLVFFDRSLKKGFSRERRIILPYSCKHRDICRALEPYLDMQEIDLVIVRNFSAVLRRVLNRQDRFGYRVGFWHSFPHDFRRLHEARQEKKAVGRKALEYAFNRFRERRLIRRVDFLITMSAEFKNSWHPEALAPAYSLPMGVDFEGLPIRNSTVTGPKKFIYIGAVDALRQSEVIARAFHRTPGEFILDFFTSSRNQTVNRIRGLGDCRIRVHPAVPREQLFRKMAAYDAGVGLIPDNELYRAASPTKAFEYYAAGLPALINALPEYVELFDHRMAFFCDFSQEAMQKKLIEVLATSREVLRQMGERGKAVVAEKRNYRDLAGDLFHFLQRVLEDQGK